MNGTKTIQDDVVKQIRNSRDASNLIPENHYKDGLMQKNYWCHPFCHHGGFDC